MMGLLWDFGVLLVYGVAMMHLGRWYFARRAAERERRELRRVAQRWGETQGVR